MAMNVSEIRLHGVGNDALNGDRCHWCDASLADGERRRRIAPRYAIDDGRRVLVEVELWACLDCAEGGEPLSAADRDDLQQRLDAMDPPRIGQCEACDSHGEIFPHFDQDEGDDYLLCERCFFETP
jgi:hypothetical protein